MIKVLAVLALCVIIWYLQEIYGHIRILRGIDEDPSEGEKND